MAGGRSYAVVCSRPQAALIWRSQRSDDDMIDPSLPLIDLHRHLDGNVRLQTILDLGREHNLPLPASTCR